MIIGAKLGAFVYFATVFQTNLYWLFGKQKTLPKRQG